MQLIGRLVSRPEVALPGWGKRPSLEVTGAGGEGWEANLYLKPADRVNIPELGQ